MIEIASLGQEVEAFILETVTDAQPVKKYGGTLFTLTPQINESQFCGVFLYKAHAQVSFSQGARLCDPQGVLLGQGKYRRHWNFATLEALDLDYLAKLLKQAAALD